jgi:hypothetical protein
MTIHLHLLRYPLAGAYFVPRQGNVVKVNPGTNNIQAAINAAGAGDTLWFQPGTYSITTTVVPKSGQLYCGPGAVMSGAGNFDLWKLNNAASANMKFDGLTFDGGRLNLTGTTGTSGSADNITVANCTFQNQTVASSTAINTGALWAVGLKNSNVINNQFTSVGTGVGGITMYEPNNVNIRYNRFTNCYQGIRFTFENVGTSIAGNNLDVSFNSGTGLVRMALELWSSVGSNVPPTLVTNNMTVTNNWFTAWNTGTIDLAQNIIAYSIVAGGTGTKINNNYAQDGPSAVGNIGIEITAQNTAVGSNYIDGWKTGAIVYYNGPTLTNNNIVNFNTQIGLYAAHSVVAGTPPNGVAISGTTNNPGLSVPARPSL